MAIFISTEKKKKYNLSRIPHGDLTVGSYIIRPYTSKLQQLLDTQLADMLKSESKCLDSQNGNVLDNIIECWKKRAKNGINRQKAYHAERINDLSIDMESNYKNANDWLLSDREELDKLVDELKDLEKEAKEYDKKMRYW